MTIDQAIEEIGLSIVAARMQTSAQRVNNWKARGVPVQEAVSFCQAVEWKVIPHDLHPKNYPHPEDGLPIHLRQAA